MILNILICIRKVQFSSLEGFLECALLPNGCVTCGSGFSDVQIHEIVVGINKRKEDNAEAPFIIIKETARVAESLYLDML
jgi:hypothetical protein